MAKRITPEGKLIELFDSVDVDRAEILLGLAKTLLKRKKNAVVLQQIKEMDHQIASKFGTA